MRKIRPFYSFKSQLGVRSAGDLLIALHIAAVPDIALKSTTVFLKGLN